MNMNKHSMATSFALIGFGLGGFLSSFSTVGVICGLGFGILVGYFVAGLTTAKGYMLQEDFVAMGNLAGKTLDEIKEKVGAPRIIQACTVADTGRKGSLCTWSEMPYSITLLFDENNICIGVNNEMIID
ncbi:MAG: hypothetical protein Q3998_04450 [Porphyromonas sp.]|nr:hypothetical protein [Porphyromonas sp.]